jgi:flagellar hook-associated protein 3 FlgL
MLAGLAAFNSTFLVNLNATENRIARINEEITSGVRVNQASDDPAAVAAILHTQNEIEQSTQAQTNLNRASTVSTSADGALQSAASLLDQLTSLAAQGANGTATATSRTVLGQQVQAIEQQLVAIANTTVEGRYIFGGDDPSTQPYTFDWSVVGGVVQNNTAANTATISNAGGSTIVPGMTAQQIFDARNPDTTPAAGNVFQAVYALGQALQNNDQPGVLAATGSIKAAAAQLGQATTFYGNTQSWLSQSTDQASSTLINLRQELSSLRDSDVAKDATDLTLAQTALQAALAAHGSLTVKSLFDYLG